jgi:hypothetical protein
MRILSIALYLALFIACRERSESVPPLPNATATATESQRGSVVDLIREIDACVPDRIARARKFSTELVGTSAPKADALSVYDARRRDLKLVLGDIRAGDLTKDAEDLLVARATTNCTPTTRMAEEAVDAYIARMQAGLANPLPAGMVGALRPSVRAYVTAEDSARLAAENEIVQTALLWLAVQDGVEVRRLRQEVEALRTRLSHSCGLFATGCR